jgi:hypothetical protein
MIAAVQTKKTRSRPKLHKRFVTTYEGWKVYSVDASALRNIAQADEEFGNFATRQEFPNLIPKREIWIGEKNLDKEGVFFVSDALTQSKEKERGVSDDCAYNDGLNAERSLLRD